MQKSMPFIATYSIFVERIPLSTVSVTEGWMERFLGSNRSYYVFLLNVLTRIDCWSLTWVATCSLNRLRSHCWRRRKALVGSCGGPVKILIMEVQECRLGPRKAVGIFRVRRQSC